MNIDQSRAPYIRARGSTPWNCSIYSFPYFYFLCPSIHSVMAITATFSLMRELSLTILSLHLSPIGPGEGRIFPR